MTKRYYIGLAASFHDPAMAIVDPDGQVVFAEATERYMQDKRAFNCPPDHLVRMPKLIEEYVAADAEIVIAISWSEKLLRLAQLSVIEDLIPQGSLIGRGIELTTRASEFLIWPYPNFKWMRLTMSMSVLQAAINVSRAVRNKVQVRRYEHHLTHAALACYSSPFAEAVCAVIDGYGEGGSTGFYVYRDGGISRLDKPPAWYSNQNSSSLGGFYSQLCALCGFDPIQGEEWKVMGLAPYGKVDPELYARLKAMVKVKDLNVFLGASRAELRRNLDVLKSMRRPPKSPPIEAADLACTGQVVFCEAMRELLENLSRKGISKNLAFAGGCALNSSWNGEILRATSFERLHIPSAPADDGNSLGAALLAYYEDHPKSPPPRKVMTPYLGTGISAESLDHLARFSSFKRVRRSPGSVTRETAKLLAEGNIVGWMQGNAEFGPRALGHRSILADPRSRDMKDKINARVKFREEFRPFAPSILHEFGPEYFEDYQEIPYMDRTLIFREAVRHKVAAVVHENGTGRLQTVKREWSEIYYQLIHDFYELTGVPVLLNTSFNVMGKPIIHSVEDAAAMFMTSGLDVLVIGDLIIEKEPAPSAL